MALNRFFGITLACISISSNVFALTESDKQLIQSAKQNADLIINNAPSTISLDSVDMSSSYKDIAKDFNLSLTDKQIHQMSEQTAGVQTCNQGSQAGSCNQPTKKQGYYILISRSMPDDLIKKSMIQASENNISIALLGTQPGQDINIDYQYWLGIAQGLKDDKKIEKLPSVLIDPEVYQLSGASHVPAIVRFRGEDYSMVSGSSSKQLLDELDSIHGPKTHDSENTVYPIEEVDFIQDLKNRMANVDWKKMRKKAYQNYWKKEGRFVRLPMAKEPSEFWVDLTVIAQKDILLKDGTPIATKGQKFNPLSGLKLSKKYLIFNPKQERQLEIVNSIIDDSPNQVFMLIATELDHKRGWSDLAKIVRKFNQRVFLLTEEMKSRFNLKSVPSLVQQDGAYLKVTEFEVL